MSALLQNPSELKLSSSGHSGVATPPSARRAVCCPRTLYSLHLVMLSCSTFGQPRYLVVLVSSITISVEQRLATAGIPEAVALAAWPHTAARWRRSEQHGGKLAVKLRSSTKRDTHDGILRQGRCLNKTYLFQRFSLVHILHVGRWHVQAVVRAIVLEVVVVREHILNMPRPEFHGVTSSVQGLYRSTSSTDHNLNLQATIGTPKKCYIRFVELKIRAWHRVLIGLDVGCEGMLTEARVLYSGSCNNIKQHGRVDKVSKYIHTYSGSCNKIKQHARVDKVSKYKHPP